MCLHIYLISVLGELFAYIGSFNLKEAVNLCLKEALKDSLTPSFTWWGREGGSRPLYNARIIIAIYGTSVFLFLHVDINIIITYLFLSINCVFYVSLQNPYAKIDIFRSRFVRNFKPRQRKQLFELQRKELGVNCWVHVRACRIQGIAIFGMTRQCENKKRQIMRIIMVINFLTKIFC